MNKNSIFTWNIFVLPELEVKKKKKNSRVTVVWECVDSFHECTRKKLLTF